MPNGPTELAIRAELERHADAEGRSPGEGEGARGRVGAVRTNRADRTDRESDRAQVREGRSDPPNSARTSSELGRERISVEGALQ